MTVIRLIVVIMLATGSGAIAGAVGTSALDSGRLAEAAARTQVDAAQITDLLGQVSGLQQQIAGLQAAAATGPAPACPEVPAPATAQNRRWPNGWTVQIPNNPAHSFFGPSIR